MKSSAELFPNYKSVYTHRGRPYLDILRDVHSFLRPRSYLEIGVSEGASLSFSSAISLAVDPVMKPTFNVIGNKERLHLFQQKSDDFFASNNVIDIASGRIELCFLDGLHLSEVLLRDFSNSEALCAENGLIIIHDCLPTDIYMVRRDQGDADVRKMTPTPGSWTGDVWKILLVLSQYRPDLKILCVDAPPTGLVLVSGLNPSSKILEDNRTKILAEMMTLELDEKKLSKFIETQHIQSTESIKTEDLMRSRLQL